MSSPETRKRRKVTRSRAGCLSCRHRRKRCDMTKPTCGACTRLHIECAWPQQQIQTQPQPQSQQQPQLQPQIQSQVQTQSQLSTHAQTRTVPNHGQAGTSASLGSIGTFAQTSFPIFNTSYGQAPGTVNFDFSDSIFGPDLELNDETLQAWAAGCMTLPSDAFDPAFFLPTPSPATRAKTPQPLTTRPSDPAHSALLSYFQDTLSGLVSVTDVGAPSAFNAFGRLAGLTTPGGHAAQALHLAIMAWAGMHAVNNGQPRFEVMSERLGQQASELIKGHMGNVSQDETLTVFAATLMVAHFKICRGDISDYRWIVEYLKSLCIQLYPVEGLDLAMDSQRLHFFENLVYHDVLSSFISSTGPIVPAEIMERYSTTDADCLHSLTGVSLPLFFRIHRVAALHRQRRANGPPAGWTDDQLMDIVNAAEGIERELQAEKQKLDLRLREKPQLKAHQYLHEAYRTACLLALRANVLSHPPESVSIRLLVRQALSLLETMNDQNLPGWCSAHWILFMSGVCAEGEDGDRARVLNLYEDKHEQFGFGNNPRSMKIVKEVWARRAVTSEPVDWVDIVQEWEWEIFIV